MSLFAIILLLIVSSICQGYPHDVENLAHDHEHDEHEHHHHHNIIDLAANLAASFKLNVSTHMKSSELMSCISEDYRNNIHEQCDEKLHHQQDYIPPMSAECFLTLIKALDNVTELLDVAVLITQTIEISSLTAEQKKSASASLEFCVENNFTHPDPPPFASAEKKIDGFTMDKIFNGMKYDKRSNPMRVMVCLACALIENGCSSVPISKKSDLVTAPISIESIDTDISSEEKTAMDDDDVIAS